MSETVVPVLEVRNIAKQYPGVRALDGVDFDVLPGEVHVLLGPNGAGKSTLIKCVSGAVAPSEGEILVEGEPLPTGEPSESMARGVGTIYQELDLVEDLTVAESVFLGHEIRRAGVLDRGAMRKETADLLERLDHSNISPTAKVRSLRPAGQQIVSIARALSRKIRLLIMDEPSAILDDHEIETLFGVVRRLTDEGVGVIYISHRLDEVKRIGDRVTVLSDGRTVAVGLPADTPQDALVEHMVGRKVDQLYPERAKRGRRRAARGPRPRAVPGCQARVAGGSRGRGRRHRRPGRRGSHRAAAADLRPRPRRRGRGRRRRRDAAGRPSGRGDRGRARPGAGRPQVAGPAARVVAGQQRHAGRRGRLPAPRAAEPAHRAQGGGRGAARAQHQARQSAGAGPGAIRRQPAEGRARALADAPAARCCCSTSPPAASTWAPRPRSTA